jgi:hypothetical protein
MSIAAGDYIIAATSFGEGETGSYMLTTQLFVPEPSSRALATAALLLTAGLAARRRRES